MGVRRARYARLNRRVKETGTRRERPSESSIVLSLAVIGFLAFLKFLQYNRMKQFIEYPGAYLEDIAGCSIWEENIKGNYLAAPIFVASATSINLPV